MMTIKKANFHMAHPTNLQDTAMKTSVAREEKDYIVAVEGRTTLILGVTPIAPKAIIVAEDMQGDIVAISKVPIVEDSTMEIMEDTTKMDNRNHVQTQFKKLI